MADSDKFFISLSGAERDVIHQALTKYAGGIQFAGKENPLRQSILRIRDRLEEEEEGRLVIEHDWPACEGQITLNARTKKRQGSEGSLLILDKDGVKVSRGKSYSWVEFTDLNLKLVMDPKYGDNDWENPQWVANVAWSIILPRMTPEIMVRMLDTARKRGQKEGRAEKLAEYKKWLGL